VKQGLVIWGASGHALVVAEIIRLVNTYQIMIDDMKPERAGSEFAGYEVLGGRESLDSLWERQVRTMIVGFGNCHGRLQVARFLRERDSCWQRQSIREQRLPSMFRLVPDR
jgi:UDP-N-acetylbacillosamine N-acetyltransferase